MREHELTGQVQRYLEGLGYSASLIEKEVRIGPGERVDLVVYDRDVPHIVVDINTSEEFPQNIGSSKLRFDPHVRKIQSYAVKLNAPFFLLTNGKINLWFGIDDSGRPQVLDDPVLPRTSASEVSAHLTKDIIVRKLNELRNELFRNDAKTSTEQLATIIYAKLLSERGDQNLQYSLATGTINDAIISQENLSRYLLEIVDRRTFADAFESLKHITLSKARPRDLLSAIDEVIIRKQPINEFPRIPRWLNDLLVRLSNIHHLDRVLDMYSPYGDIYAGLFMPRLNTYPTAFLGICPNAQSFLWANIQQLILGSHGGTTTFHISPGLPYELELWSPNRIVVAPPFGGKINTPDLFTSSPDLSYPLRTEELYLWQAINWVPEGGRVVILVPEGLLFASSKLQLRQALLNNMRIAAIISLVPSISPLPLKTSILVLDKGPTNDPYEVFLSQIREVPSSEAFDCRESKQISRMLRAFDQWMSFGRLDSTTDLQVLPIDTLEANNLSASHYLISSRMKVGDVDSVFPLVLLDEIATDIKRGAKIRLDEQGTQRVIGPGTIRPMFLDIENIGRTSQEHVPQGAPFVQSGDVVINNIGSHLGGAAAIDEDLNGLLVSQHAIIIRPDEKRILPEYLAIALNSDLVRNQAEGMASGGDRQSLNVNAIRQLFIPVPDMSFQLRIIEKMRRARVEVLQAQEQLSRIEARFTALIHDLTNWEGEA